LKQLEHLQRQGLSLEGIKMALIDLKQMNYSAKQILANKNHF